MKRLVRSLERVVRECDVSERLQRDPVGIVRRFERSSDRELVGLLASALAFGNVVAVRASIEDALGRLGPDITVIARRPVELARVMAGFRHRWVTGQDVAGLLAGAGGMQRRYGSLGMRLTQLLGGSDDLRTALAQWTQELRSVGRLGETTRGGQHILASPARDSACKRLLLYMRWMVRADDGVDLGIWTGISPSVLVIPLDTHIHRLALNLGMTRRGAASWRTAEEVTAVLRAIDPADPVRFDFALCHLGMAQGCPSKRAMEPCQRCGIRLACVHWSA